MKVRVRITGALARPGGRDDFETEVGDGARLEDLLLALGYRPAHLRAIVTAVNGSQERLARVLAPGDEVTLFLPASGG